MITIYKTNDGKTFENIEDAKIHEAECDKKAAEKKEYFKKKQAAIDKVDEAYKAYENALDEFHKNYGDVYYTRLLKDLF